MALSAEEIAARKAARQARLAQERVRLDGKATENARLAEEAKHAQRFNKRSTRNSVEKGVYDHALTIDEYRIGVERGLVGPVSHPEPLEPYDAKAATERLGVPVTSRSVGQAALSYGDQGRDPIGPNSYVPSGPSERRARAERLSNWVEDDDGGYWFRPGDDLNEIDDQTLEDLGVDVRAADWFPHDDSATDRYTQMAHELFDGCEPQWDLE